MRRGNIVGMAIAVATLAVGGVALAHGSPAPPPYRAHDMLAGQTLYQPPEPPAALIVGDSYAAGTGAHRPGSSFAVETATGMGWIADLDAQGGTGFVNNGHTNDPTHQPYLYRLTADRQRYKVDLVMVTGGRNDITEADAPAAVREYLSAVHSAYPKLPLVVVAPFWSDGHPPAALLQIRDTEKTIAADYHATFIDPLAEQWITDANAGRYISSDRTHPNQTGHDYLAQRLVADLKRVSLSV